MQAFTCALVAAAAIGMASPALAQWDDFNGYQQITRGDYVAAEAFLLRQQRMFPADADILLNLAAVYARTGRSQLALVAYRRVLDTPDAALDLRDGSAASSHALARAGMTRLEPIKVSAR